MIVDPAHAAPEKPDSVVSAKGSTAGFEEADDLDGDVL
jgi:hypothetical protein